MKWDLGGRTDNFQIEVGMATLAWGVVAIASVLLDWGTYAQAALTLVFGLYLLFAASIHLRIFFFGAISRAPFGRAGSTDHDNEPADAVLRVRGPRGSLIHSATRPSGGRGFVIIQSSGMCGPQVS